MNPTRHKLEVRGIKVTTTTPRRWAVVNVRPETWVEDENTWVPFARVLKRTDNLDVARREKRRIGRYKGSSQ